MHPGTLRALRSLRLAQGGASSGLVILDAAGGPVHPDTFSWRFKTLCADAGVRFPGSIHATRHTLATALEEAGTPANQGAALLGHDVATYTRFYLVADQAPGPQRRRPGDASSPFRALGWRNPALCDQRV